MDRYVLLSFSKQISTCDVMNQRYNQLGRPDGYFHLTLMMTDTEALKRSVITIKHSFLSLY